MKTGSPAHVRKISLSILLMWAGIALLLVTWLFPPWQGLPGDPTLPLDQFRPLWEMPGWWHIDTAKLLLVDAMIVAVTSGLVVTFHRFQR